MKKEELYDILEEYGDAVVNYRSTKTNKLKYSVVTTNFSTEYIKKQPKKLKNVNNRNIIVFSWDEDRYKVLVPEQVTSILPLSKMLGNY